MKGFGWRFLPLLSFLLLSIFFWRGLSLNPHQLPSTQIGKPVPAFLLPQLGNSKSLISRLPKQVLLLNVWASWCEACTEEQAFLLELAQEGVLIYGLNYKDETQDALLWLRQWGNPYQFILQDRKGRMGIDLGVYGVPETFIIDKKGLIRYRHAGLLSSSLWLSTIAPLMNQLEQES